MSELEENRNDAVSHYNDDSSSSHPTEKGEFVNDQSRKWKAVHWAQNQLDFEEFVTCDIVTCDVKAQN